MNHEIAEIIYCIINAWVAKEIVIMLLRFCWLVSAPLPNNNSPLRLSISAFTKLLVGLLDLFLNLGFRGLVGGGVGGSPGRRNGYESVSFCVVGILPVCPLMSPSPIQKPPFAS